MPQILKIDQMVLMTRAENLLSSIEAWFRSPGVALITDFYPSLDKRFLQTLIKMNEFKVNEYILCCEIENIYKYEIRVHKVFIRVGFQRKILMFVILSVLFL